MDQYRIRDTLSQKKYTNLKPNLKSKKINLLELTQNMRLTNSNKADVRNENAYANRCLQHMELGKVHNVRVGVFSVLVRVIQQQLNNRLTN